MVRFERAATLGSRAFVTRGVVTASVVTRPGLAVTAFALVLGGADVPAFSDATALGFGSAIFEGLTAGAVLERETLEAIALEAGSGDGETVF